MERVVITGMGAVTAFGRGVSALFEGLRRGTSALTTLEGIPVSRGKSKGGQIKDPSLVGPFRLSDILALAVDEALRQSGLTTSEGGPIGLFVATTAGERRALEDRFGDFESLDADAGLREAILRFPNSALADDVAQRFGLRGPRDVNTNACASGNVALARALCALRLSQVTRAVVCGADQLKTTAYWGAERAGFIGHDLRPFHQHRDGSVLGEGAAALVLETAAAARARAAKPLATLSGWGISCDQNPQAIVPQLDGEANARAVRLALADAGVSPDDVDYFNAHGTGTINIDRLETLASKRVFGARAHEIPMSSTKSLTGHLSAASPIVEAIACILALTQHYIHPTAKLDMIASDLDLDYVPIRGRQHTVRCAVSNSMGGGGTNAVVVLAHPSLISSRNGHRTEEREVVITGTGVIGRGIEGSAALWRRLLGGACGKRSDAAEVDLLRYLDEGLGYQHLNRNAALTLIAAQMACAEADLGEHPARPDRTATIFGTALGGTPEWSSLLCRALATSPRLITPRMALDHGPHLGVTLIARTYGVLGATLTLTGGPPAGLQAIGFARDLIRLGTCDVAIVGGADVVDQNVIRALRCIDASGRNGRRRVWDRTDAAACVILESRHHSDARGARALATVSGFGAAGAPVGVGRYDLRGESLREAMSGALGNAAGEEVIVFGAVYGSRALAAGEARAIATIRRRYHIRPLIASLQPHLGETFAAGGVLGVIAAVNSLGQGMVPGATDVSMGAEGARSTNARHALVNAAGPGGAAASVHIGIRAETAVR